MTSFLDFFRPGFLLHNAFYGSIAAGLFCAIIGVYFMLRRMILLGVALPQISAAGIAFAFFLQGLGFSWSLHAGEANDRFLALGGSVFFTLTALLILAWFGRKGEGYSESRLGAAYALAYAVAILGVVANPTGEIEMLHMLHGEIVSVNSRDLRLLLGIYGLLGILVALFNKELLLVSFDRESAQVMGKKVAAWDVALYGIVGVAISMSVLIIGPMLTFAFLTIPPLAARRFCKRMGTFFLLSSLIGGASALIGFYVSYHWDWPLGPTDILVASLLLALAFLIEKLPL